MLYILSTCCTWVFPILLAIKSDYFRTQPSLNGPCNASTVFSLRHELNCDTKFPVSVTGVVDNVALRHGFLGVLGPTRHYHSTKVPFSPLCFGLGKRSQYADSLRAGRSGDRIPVGARFSAPFQTGPVAHPASCSMGTGSFPGVKRLGRGVDHPSTIYSPLDLNGLF